MPSSRERKVLGSTLGQVKSDTVLQTPRYRCNIVVVTHIYSLVAGQRRTLTIWKIGTLFIKTNK